MANAKIKHLQLPNGTTYDFHAVTADSTTSATTSSKLSTNAGSATNPVYFTGGVPTACTYSLNKTVPSNAVFTDTNTHRPIQINGTEILGNNTTALNLKAGSNVLVTNTNGTVTIEATDTDTTYTLSADTTNNEIKLTPSSGFTQSITVPYARIAGSVSIPTANPEIATYYMPIFGYGTGDTDTPILYKHSNDYTYYLREGTTSHVGESALILGNGVSSGTDGNSRGELLLYSEGAVRSALMMTNSGSGVVSTYNHYLPAVAGTIGVFTATPTSGQVVVTDGTAGGFKTTGYTIAKSVPSNAVFTDTNVTQTATSTNANYEVLFSATADNTTRTEGARKNSNLIFNPATGLKIGTSSQSTFPTTGIQVHDVRSVNFTPGALDQGVNFFFSNNTMPNGNWWSGIHVKGWTGAYAAWEIVGSAHNNDSRTTPLYVRSSNTNSAWGSWRKIYDTSNPPSKSEVGLGNVDNTADANKSVSHATTSGTANTAKAVLTAGGDVVLGTTDSTSDDSGDIVWRYGNGQEKARLWAYTEYTAKGGLNYRAYKKDGTSVYTGTIPLADGTGASGTWGISITGSAGSATSATTATKARQLGDATIRPTTANTTTYDGALKYFLSSSSMSTAKPMADGGILSMEWDNNGGYTKQLYLGHGGGTSTRMQVRSQAAGTWGSWIPVGVFSQTTPTSGQVVITDGTDGGIKSSGYTIAKSVPSDAVFTDHYAWSDITGKPSTYTPASHTHGIADITWAGNANLATSATANNQEWSIDLNSGSYTGTYWHIWSGKNSKTILACYTDTNDVKVPNGSFYVNGEVVVGSGIELGTASASSPSLIDFHWNTTMSGNDFTARIWQRGENTVDLIGKNSSTWGIWRAGSFSTQSSIHAKENIQDITVEDSKKLLQLRPVTFNYKNGGLTDQAGLIAEEVYLVMPKMVIGDINYNPEEPWNTPSIDYSKFVPYLIKMIQEQQKEIDELRRLVQG